MARGDDDRIRDDRGRGADRPSEIPASGWRDIALRSWKESSDDNVGMIAAGVAFYGFLAIVPLLAALVLSYGLFAAPDTVMSQAKALFGVLPRDAAKLIADQMVSISKQSSGKSGLGLAFSLALSLYGGMRGATAIVAALNIAYDERESRNFIRTTILSLVITVGGVLVGIVGLTAMGALAALDALIPNAPSALVIGIHVIVWALAAVIASFGVAVLYRYGPDRDQPKWRWLTPGAIFATLGWIVMTLGFGIYAANFGNYNATYGALGAVVVLLMWLYLSAYILIFGGELNSEIEHQTEVDTTRGAARPMGTRDAYVADTVGEIPENPLAKLTGKKASPKEAGPAARRDARADAPDRGMAPSAERPIPHSLPTSHQSHELAGVHDKDSAWKGLVVTLGLICVFDLFRKRGSGGTATA